MYEEEHRVPDGNLGVFWPIFGTGKRRENAQKMICKNKNLSKSDGKKLEFLEKSILYICMYIYIYIYIYKILK